MAAICQGASVTVPPKQPQLVAPEAICVPRTTRNTAYWAASSSQPARGCSRAVATIDSSIAIAER